MFVQIDFPPIEECPPIDLAKQYELRYWSNRLKLSPDQLRAVIAAVGSRPIDVQRCLRSVSIAAVSPSRGHVNSASGRV